ncbi:hypothetical protein COCMIDRAFT_3989 [Bipolaris oryzae ATCC 44560]|uniref:BZIP domain-containing protein n=1 Tax=Bipolaris oryzae ATCC 44560 TaxID=930090 RepID=W6ZHV3_COCMI|nr:uncharacterized protein COCMIDRAFT_3989 [Bipolaris oryzae ATCC 44560]EUC46994.1 hypothetical protein COCMIDRAFT_3989 [Bipolaris oryzae ATCC 44560]
MPAEKRRKPEALATVPERGDPGQRRRDKIASLEAQVNVQNSSQSHIELDVAPSLETAANSGSSAVSPKNTSNVEEHNFSSFGGAMLAFDAVDIDFSLSSDFDIQNLPTSLSLSTTPENPTTAALLRSNTPPSPNALAGPDSQPSPFTFPLTPDANLDVPIMAALQAFMTIASLLDIVQDTFNPFALHTSPPTPHPSLPLNLHPVPAQILIPHHPALDALPWPSVREKLICILHLPSPQRPPIARGTRGEPIQRIMHDMDDYTSGCRVHGNASGWSAHHEMAEESWEIGDAFYRNWWFCVDSKIISTTNARRRERGEAPLSLEDVRSV